MLAVGAGSGAAGGLAQRLVATGGKSAGTLSDVVVDATIGSATAGVLRGASVALRNTTARPPVASGRVLGSEGAFRRQYSALGRGRLGAETWGKRASLGDHFRRHGADFGARTADDYAAQASSFLRKSQVERLPTKTDARGVIRIYDPKTNTFGAYNADGTTRTFYKPDPAAHGYATNLDYWNAQPGASP
jgi:hypothetical protein